jgi:hypothetical protein
MAHAHGMMNDIVIVIVLVLVMVANEGWLLASDSAVAKIWRETVILAGESRAKSQDVSPSLQHQRTNNTKPATATSNK